MTIRKSSEYRREATKREPFELELEDGGLVAFKDPNALDTKSAFDLAETDNPREICQILLGDDYQSFWAEWRKRPVEETNALIGDAMEHYGVEPGKQDGSRR